MYGSAYKSQFRPKGTPHKLHSAAEDFLIKYLEDQP